MVEGLQRLIDRIIPTPYERLNTAFENNNLQSAIKTVRHVVGHTKNPEDYYYTLKTGLYNLAKKYNIDPYKNSLSFQQYYDHIIIKRYVENSNLLSKGADAGIQLVHTSPLEWDIDYDCDILGETFINSDKNESFLFRYRTLEGMEPMIDSYRYIRRAPITADPYLQALQNLSSKNGS